MASTATCFYALNRIIWTAGFRNMHAAQHIEEIVSIRTEASGTCRENSGSADQGCGGQAGFREAGSIFGETQEKMMTGPFGAKSVTTQIQAECSAEARQVYPNHVPVARADEHCYNLAFCVMLAAKSR